LFSIEDRVVVEPAEAARPQEMREPVAAPIELGIGHHFALCAMMNAGCCGRILACKPGYIASSRVPACGSPSVTQRIPACSPSDRRRREACVVLRWAGSSLAVGALDQYQL